MTAVTRDRRLPNFRDLDGCPKCGCWDWEHAEIDGVARPGLYRCGECNAVLQRHELLSAEPVGEPYLQPFIDGIRAFGSRAGKD